MTEKTRRPRSPKQVDPQTGLPEREPEVGASLNASPAREKAARTFSLDAARVLRDDRCEDIVVLDLRGRSQVTDYFVVASGTSDRQMRSAADDVADLGETREMALYRSNLTEKRPNWIVLDFVDVVVHVLSPEARLYYDIEMLWGDAPRVEWDRPARAPATRTTSRRAPAKRATEDSGAAPGEKVSRNRAGLTPDDVLPARPRKKR